MRVVTGFAAFLIALPVLAAPPPGYYQTAEGKAGGELRAALHAIIRAHHVIPYSSSGFDTSDALKILDQDPANPGHVLLIYATNSVPASTFGNAGWNREHLWPQSYGLDGIEPSYSDLHNLRACDASVNSSRGNKYYDFSDPNAPGYAFPAYPEAPLCSTDFDSWQPPAFQRGDIARAMFYLATRYTGDKANEPALGLTDATVLISSTTNLMGKLSTLLAWHQAAPVDAAEQFRNDRIYWLYQTNRNPFVDHPEWVNLTFAPTYTNPPTLNLTLASNGIVLTWLATNQSAHLEATTHLPDGWMTMMATTTLTNSQFRVFWTNPATCAFRLRSE